MKAPSARLLVAIGAILTLCSGVVLAVDVATTAVMGGPFGFLDGIYVICLVPGVLLLIAAFILYTGRAAPKLAGYLGIVAAMSSIPIALAGFWIGFVLAMVGSLFVIAKRNEDRTTRPVGSGDPPSPSSTTRRGYAGRWGTSIGIVLVALVAILLVCPQTLSADVATVGDLLNDPVAYDLQAGFIFGTGGGSISYEVSATPQSRDCELGYAYLVNGYVNDSGQLYWYQAGLSYDWGGGYLTSAGWALTYEVFGPNGASIYPALYAGAGVAPFSGSVNPGDTVLLSMTLGTGGVSFTAVDQTTHASASESYSQFGTQSFGGELPPQNPGYFTGLMTECYRNVPNNVDISTVTYTDEGAAQSEGAVFVDELDFSGGRFPYLPSVELAEQHSPVTNLFGPTTTSYDEYGVAIQFGATTFITGSG